MHDLFIQANAKKVCEIGVFLPEYCKSKYFINNGIKTILIEANPLCIKDIKEEFGSKDNVEIHNKAIFDRVGEISIYNRGKNPDASAFISELPVSPSITNDDYKKNENDKLKCEATTFDLIDPGDIDILFLDIEGAEWYAIKTMKSRPKIISVELSGINYVNPFKSEIEAWMLENNYTLLGELDGDFIFTKNTMINYNLYNVKIDELDLFCYDTPGSTTANGTYHAITSNKFKFKEVDFNDGDNYIEVGAHNGLLAFYLSKLQPNINIHIFECNPIMINAINMGIIKNNITNIFCYPFGLSSETKNSKLGINLQNTGGSSLLIHSGHTDEINVNIFDFETFLSIFKKVKYLKIDIEGEEFKIFKKLIQSASRFFDKVDFLNLELHDGVYKELNIERGAILAYIKEFQNLKLILQD